MSVLKRLVVLGAGPGGYAAAFEAARDKNVQVTLIERRALGGTCLNVGCIPTKTILRSAHVLDAVRDATEYAVNVAGGARLDVDALRARKDRVVGELVSQIADTARRLKVETVCGTGVLTGSNEITVTAADGTESSVPFDALIIATGSVPVVIPPLAVPGVWTSDDALTLDTIPESIVIVGGGVIGVEFASFYAALGVDVTVVELTPALLPGFDARVQRSLAAALTASGVRLVLGDSVCGVERADDGGFIAQLSSGDSIRAAAVLCAVGRAPHTADMGFEQAGLEFDRRALVVDRYFRTNVPGIYAIGDAIAGVMLAHAAEAEGRAAAQNAVAALTGAEPAATVDARTIPGCVYTTPEVATVGLSAAAAKEAGLRAVSAIAKYSGNGRALAEGAADGFVQLVADADTGCLIGAQLVGQAAVELIAVPTLAVAQQLPVSALAHTVFAHPTLAEVIKTAAETLLTKL